MHLDTMSWQAPEFYKKHGYEVIGILPDIPSGNQKYLLMKSLEAPENQETEEADDGKTYEVFMSEDTYLGFDVDLAGELTLLGGALFGFLPDRAPP